MGTISSTITQGITLSVAGSYASPLTITSAGAVDTTSTAIYGPPSDTWTVVNAGTVAATNTSANGIDLRAGGYVGNTGQIAAGRYAIRIGGAPGYVTNAGYLSGGKGGVQLRSGGYVTNQTAGVIVGSTNAGVYVTGGDGTVTNAGTIIGGSAGAVMFSGSYTDRVIIDPGAVFTGDVVGGSGSNTLELAQGSGATGTITGIGTKYVNFDTIVVDPSAAWVIGKSAYIAAGTTLIDRGTLNNRGTIATSGTVLSMVTVTSNGVLYNNGNLGTAVLRGGSLINKTDGTVDTSVHIAGSIVFPGGTIDNIVIPGTTISNIEVYGTIQGIAAPSYIDNSGRINAYIDLAAGGVVINNSGGSIGVTNTLQGAPLIVIAGVAGTVVNSGSIVTNHFDAIDLAAGGTVTNQAGGYIGGDIGVYITSGGLVTNAGTIAGSGLLGVGVFVYSGAGTVTNTGLIAGNGTGVAGVVLEGGGIVSNYGVISGGGGVSLLSGGTLINGGTIVGGSLFSVIAVGDDSLVVMKPDAVFIGAVEAQNLELASGHGVISGNIETLGEGGAISVDSGGSWSFDKYVDTIATTISDQGTLTNRGTIFGAETVTSGAILDNRGTIISLAGAQVLEVRNGGALDNSGTIIGAATVKNGGSVDNTGTIFGAVVSNGGILDNSGTLIEASVDGTLINRGSITIGATVTNGGVLDNRGGFYAVLLAGGTLLNRPSGTGAHTLGSGVISNGGTFAGGVELTSGGTLINTSSGVVDGIAVLQGAAGTIINYGLLSGGAILQAGGLVSNTGAIYAGVGGGGGVVLQVVAGTVDNAGSITGGVVLQAGGLISNTGTIYAGAGGLGGVVLQDVAGTVDNAGTIVGGVVLQAGGLISNTGAIYAGAGGLGGVVLQLVAGTVDNAGSITGGVLLQAGGLISNTGAIYGGGGIGLATIFLQNGGTVVNGGTIAGPAGSYAVILEGNQATLVIEPGAVFSGGILADAAKNTLELAGTQGDRVRFKYEVIANAGFDKVQFDSYAALVVTNDTGTLPITIGGFNDPSDVIDLTGIGTDGQVTNNDTANHVLTVSGSDGSVTFNLNGSDATDFTTQPDNGSGTQLIPVCYCRGTMIATPDGEVAIEELRIGELVTTLSDEARPVRWIGRRAYDGRFIAGNREALPICIRQDALAEGVPVRDLWVSPGHSLYLDGALARAEHLINGVTIVQAKRVEAVEYFHLELDSHDVIFANGAAAETYVDCDNRNRFANAPEHAVLYPDDDRPGWTFCAPCLPWGSEALTAIRVALLDRAAQLGHRLDDDPDLRLLVDGEILRPERRSAKFYRFSVPSGRWRPPHPLAHQRPRGDRRESARLAYSRSRGGEAGLFRRAPPHRGGARQFAALRGLSRRRTHAALDRRKRAYAASAAAALRQRLRYRHPPRCNGAGVLASAGLRRRCVSPRHTSLLAPVDP